MQHRITQAPGTPRNDGIQLLLAELVVGPDRGAEDRVVLLSEPSGLARQVDGNIQFKGRYQFPGVVADDNFGVINDGDRQRLDTAAAQVLDRGGLAQQIVMFVLNAVGLEELFQSPAAESTRLGIDLNVHDHTSFLREKMLRVSYHGREIPGMEQTMAPRKGIHRMSEQSTTESTEDWEISRERSKQKLRDLCVLCGEFSDSDIELYPDMR